MKGSPICPGSISPFFSQSRGCMHAFACQTSICFLFGIDWLILSSIGINEHGFLFPYFRSEWAITATSGFVLRTKEQFSLVHFSSVRSGKETTVLLAQNITSSSYCGRSKIRTNDVVCNTRSMWRRHDHPLHTNMHHFLFSLFFLWFSTHY